MITNNLSFLKAFFRLLFIISSIYGWGQVVNTYSYTGSNHSFTVPSGVTSITVKIWGAGGGGSDGSGGSGAFLKGTLAVNPGDQYIIVVGGGGTYATGSHNGGFGGGGNAGNFGGSGGGYSGLFLNSISQSNARVIAGGGGGGGYHSNDTFGGAGGAVNGTSAGNQNNNWTGGSGATLTSGGNGGQVGNSNGTVGSNGTLLQGGNGGSSTYGGGGGGGGFYGGGGGYGSILISRYSSGGGGGSSLVSFLTGITNIQGVTNNLGASTQAPGNSEPEYVLGVGNGGDGSMTVSGGAGGNGLVIISYIPANDAGVTTIPTLTCQGAQNVVATIRNYGTSNLTSATINWSVNGVAQTPFSWTGNLVTNATANVTIGSFNFSPSTNYTITAATSLPNGVTDNNSSNDSFTTASFQTNSGPTNVNITNANEVVCKNTVKTLTATGGVVNNAVIFSENFNSGIGTFTQTNSSTGGTPANAAWTNRANGYNYTYFSDSTTFTSNDSSSFMLSNSANQGSNTSAITQTTLVSPIFSLVGVTNPRLNFYQYFRNWDNTDFGRVEISVNGGSYVTLATYGNSGNSGSASSFNFENIDLSAYIGQSNLRIRFRYDAVWSWFWAIDNVSVIANRQNITWSSSPSSPNTIFTDAAATVPYVSGTHATTVYVKPTVTTTYTATSTNGGCTTTDVVTYSMETAVYNGSSWTPAQASNRAIEFQGNYTSSGTGINLQACSCTVTSGNVSIASGDTMTLQEEMIVNGGSITFEKNANLLQTNPNAINTGNIIVKREAQMKRLDYTYWSAPVTGQNLKSFSPNTLNSRFYVYNEATDFFSTIDPLSNSFAIAAGYAVRAPNNYPSTLTTQDWTFTGVPNNGTKTISITKNGNGFNLIGNPYPSNLSFYDFYTANSTIINDKAFFWTNTNLNPPAQQGTTYSGNNYAILTSTGGTPATNSSIAPTDEIAVGQGFIVEKTNAGASTVTFNNTMRTNTNGVFFNSRIAPPKPNPKYWLKLTTPAKNFNTLLVGYVPGATNAVDASFDAEPIVRSSDMFYSIQDEKNLIVQGRTANFSIKDKVHLGAVFYETGQYEIAIAKVEGIFQKAQPIYLKDQLLNIMVNLNEGAYTFYADAGVVNNRFEIVYKPDSTLSTEDLSQSQLQVYQTEGWLVIESPEGLSRVWVTDATGKQLYQSEVNGKTTRIQASHYPSGQYYITVETSSGQKQTKKILKK